jgi:hypothetical protein
MRRPKLIHNIFFWIVLGFLSTFFAETFSGSSPDFLFKTFGYFGIIPIYLLHSVLLAAIVIRRGKPFSLRSLYFVSLLFGMYEAYITKVLWSPTWNEGFWHIAGMAVAETSLLVFFWHAVFSFLLPLFWLESLSMPTPRLPALLPEKWRAWLVGLRGAILTGLVGGIMAGSAIASPPQAFVILLADSLALSLLVFLFRRANRKEGFNLSALLPRRGEVIVLAALLFLVYLFFGLFLRRDVHPGVVGHAAVLVMYAGFLALLFLSLRKDRSLPEVGDNMPVASPGYTPRHWLALCASLTLSGTLVGFLPVDLRALLAGFIYLVCTGTGVMLFFVALDSLFRRPSKGES